MVEGTGRGQIQFKTLKFKVTFNGNASSVNWATYSGPAALVPGWSLAYAPEDYAKAAGTL